MLGCSARQSAGEHEDASFGALEDAGEHADAFVRRDAGRRRMFEEAGISMDAGEPRMDAGIDAGPFDAGVPTDVRVIEPDSNKVDAGPFDAGNDAGDDAGDDAGMDAGNDAGNDAGSDAGNDAGRDAGNDAGNDAGADAGSDAGHDAGMDAGHDGGTDAGSDAGNDAGDDAGDDAGEDAGHDAGSDAGRRRVVFGFTGTVQSWVVPPGVTSIEVKAWGAGGGSTGYRSGSGGFVTHPALAVTPGETLDVIVGGAGRVGAGVNPRTFGGGGAGSDHPLYAWSASGGGRSALRRGDAELLTAGGGGGLGYGSVSRVGGSGCGGALGAGTVGSDLGGGSGGGGGLSSGGLPGTGAERNGNAGAAFQGGDGLQSSNGTTLATSGGGGGGYYGGGSGGYQAHVTSGSGGGGSCFYPAGGRHEGGIAEVPGGTSDPDWDGSAGHGSAAYGPGRAGRVVILY